jgi:predicted DNA-binding transcriptional regulator AlpA
MAELIGVQQLAQLLKISTSALYKHSSGIKRCELLHDLPQPAFRGKRTLWISRDIEAWIESHRTFRPTPAQPEPQPAPRGRGRPRKTAPAGQEGGAV